MCDGSTWLQSPDHYRSLVGESWLEVEEGVEVLEDWLQRA